MHGWHWRISSLEKINPTDLSSAHCWQPWYFCRKMNIKVVSHWCPKDPLHFKDQYHQWNLASTKLIFFLLFCSKFFFFFVSFFFGGRNSPTGSTTSNSVRSILARLEQGCHKSLPELKKGFFYGWALPDYLHPQFSSFSFAPHLFENESCWNTSHYFWTARPPRTPLIHLPWRKVTPSLIRGHFVLAGMNRLPSKAWKSRLLKMRITRSIALRSGRSCGFVNRLW